jgi:hypothetical protein
MLISIKDTCIMIISFIPEQRLDHNGDMGVLGAAKYTDFVPRVHPAYKCEIDLFCNQQPQKEMRRIYTLKRGPSIEP